MPKAPGLHVFILILLCCLITACTSTPKTEKPDVLTLEELHALLGLEEEVYELGFKQHKYNPCDIGVKPIQEGRCGPEYYATVHLQLLCRNSTGTIQEAATEFALYDADLKWKMGSMSGGVALDEDGFGLIRLRSMKPLRRRKIRITSGSDFLVMRVADIKKVVVPGNWCS